MFQTVPVASIGHLVTDDRADPDVLAKLTNHGVQVHIAALPSADGGGSNPGVAS
jgi:hypothetical protein